MGLTETQSKIQAKFDDQRGFLPFLEEVRFPMYKTLEEDLRISLDWPIVALVGPNGTNKSSVLQAISAAPEGRSLAQFWFSTEVDDIDKGIRGSASHRFIYKYRFDISGTLAECRKYRGKKIYRSSDVPAALRGKRDPDYWEPTKRVASDSMEEIPAKGYDEWLSNNRDRWNQINKSVLYLDFRTELSAFDKFIHHQSFDRWSADANQKRFRAVTRSKWVAQILAKKKLPKKQAGKLIERARELPHAAVEEISAILGKPIASITIAQHSFFGPSGYTVRIRLKDSGAAYSEAHAGSGEYAVVRLVDAISRAQERSLILLDEPEVSLHPGAQEKLLRFIEDEVLRHGHQVVMSTHSPSLAAGLPPKAIKVLGFDLNKHRVVLVADGCTPTEAFAHLGQTTAISGKPRVIVEDDLAAELVRASLRRKNPARLDNLEIVPFPGGANGIVKNVLSALAMTGIEKTSILLDGDQRLTTAANHSLSVADVDAACALKDTKKLKELWLTRFHATLPNLYSDSGKNRDPEVLATCLKWATRHVGFLPGKSPEELLARALKKPPEANTTDWKDYWFTKTKSELHLTPGESVVASQILENQRSELARLPDSCPLFAQIDATIAEIIDW